MPPHKGCRLLLPVPLGTPEQAMLMLTLFHHPPFPSQPTPLQGYDLLDQHQSQAGEDIWQLESEVGGAGAGAGHACLQPLGCADAAGRHREKGGTRDSCWAWARIAPQDTRPAGRHQPAFPACG